MLQYLHGRTNHTENTINSYDGLQNSTSEYVAQLENLTAKVKELVTIVGKDYKQKVADFDKNCKSIIESANSASQNLFEATDTFSNSLNKIESKLNYSLIINIVLVVILVGIIIVLFTR